MQLTEDTLKAALSGYTLTKTRIEAKIAEIQKELKVEGKRTVSPAARERMAAAQRKRWANKKATDSFVPVAVKAPPAPKPAKRRISVAGRKRIAAATKARWAKYRAEKAKAQAKPKTMTA